MFFPHLIAGPVVLPRQLLGQLDRPRAALPVNYLGAVFLFSLGLVKKLVFADQVAGFVNPVFKDPALGWTCLDYWLAVYGFALQIYCDFSGYSDMAIGLGLLLGVKLPTNFDRPYCSQSIVEFWQRWHITLSNWLRDYLYIPLGGNRHGMAKQVRNVLITMALGGLWHGANWTFLLWGAFHGAIIALTHLGRWLGVFRLTKAVPGWIKLLATFHLVTFGWILFRARSLADACLVVKGLFLPLPSDWRGFLNAHAFPLVLLGLFALSHRWDNALRIRVFARKAPAELVWALVCVAWLLALLISAGNSAEFIYFDF
jgi:alginate O-acetyltransferase complex protein AlgI